MEFEPTAEIKEENAQIDLTGGLVDQHFGLDLSELITSAASGTGGDSSSSVSSNSPPHEWHGSWMDSASINTAAPSVGTMDPVLSFTGGATTPGDFDVQNGMNGIIDFTTMNELNSMHLGVPMDMFNHGFSFMLPPSELHKTPNMFPVPQQTIIPMPNDNNVAIQEDDDIVATIKRLTGITNAQVAGAPSAFAPGLGMLLVIQC